MNRLLAVGAVAIGLMLGPAAANAAPPKPIVPNNYGVFYCNYYSNPGRQGKACIDAEVNGFNAEYINLSSNWQYVDFNLVLPNGIHTGDQGAFWAGPNSTHTYFFNVGQAPYGFDYGYIGIYSRPPQPGWEMVSPTDVQPCC